MIDHKDWYPIMLASYICDFLTIFWLDSRSL